MGYQGRDLSTGRSEIYYYTSASGGETSISASTAGVPISYTVGWVAVYLNGIRLHDSDFTATTGSSITGLSALTKDDVVIIEAMHTFSSSDAVPATGGTFSGAITAPSIQLSSNIIKASDGGTAITLDTSDNVTLAGTANNVGTVTAGTLGSNVVFPAGHIIQVVQATSNSTTALTGTQTSITATHLTKDIQITAGNKVRWTFSFPLRLGGNETANVDSQFFIYYKLDGGSFANALSASGANYVAAIYNDQNNNMPAYYNVDNHIHVTGIHTPSSGTHHHYKLYYKYNTGSALTIGNNANDSTQFVILEEIQV